MQCDAVKQLLQLAAQFFRFAVVGLLATGVHVTTTVTMVEYFMVSYAWAANLCGVVLGVCTSYVGNYYWTFDAKSSHKSRFPRFAGAYALVFLLNSFIMGVLSDIIGVHYLMALTLCVTITPMLTFLLNRQWVFDKPPTTFSMTHASVPGQDDGAFRSDRNAHQSLGSGPIKSLSRRESL